jgi:hypothetical protein
MRGRRLAQKSKDLIDISFRILEEIQPASVRAVCYQLFGRGVIPTMKTSETQKVSRLLVHAREKGLIPWGWIVDETRAPERTAAWDNLSDYGQAIVRSYRKDFWRHQIDLVEVWSEKGTVRGVLAPVLEEFAVTFSVKHGFDSATSINNIADQTYDRDRPLIALYVGDWDPSGLCMSEKDLPERMARYGASVRLQRIALTDADVHDSYLPSSFQADTKSKDPRHRWFVENYGNECWELDALPPPILRARVREAIIAHIDMDAWEHCSRVESAELKSLRGINWRGLFSVSKY